MGFCNKKRGSMYRILMVLMAILIMAGCSMGGIYDNDKSIQSDTNSFSLSMESQKKTGQVLTGTGSMSGMDTIWVYKAEEDIELVMDCLLEVTAGKAKLVHIAPDDTLTVLTEVTQDDTETEPLQVTIPVKEGKNRIKLVAADDTQLYYSITIPEGELHSLGFSD